MKDLEKLLEQLDISKNEINDNFRLFLSTEPNPKFPITLLQRSVRVTTEPPKGIKKNMERIYYNMPEDKFSDKSEYIGNFKRLMFSLSWFHSIVIERKKFKTLGWNVIYDFNDSDLETSEKILKMYIDEKSMGPIQWDAIKYLISDVVYGGRVTDEWDRSQHKGPEVARQTHWQSLPCLLSLQNQRLPPHRKTRSFWLTHQRVYYLLLIHHYIFMSYLFNLIAKYPHK